MFGFAQEDSLVIKIPTNIDMPKVYEVAGEKLVIMSFKRNKQLASDIAQYTVIDSLVMRFEDQDSLHQQEITRKDSIIAAQEEQIKERENEIAALQAIIGNKDEAIGKTETYIKELKKEIKRQKRMKLLAYVVAGAELVLIVYIAVASAGG